MGIQIKNERYFLPLRLKFIILCFVLITIPFFVSGIISYNEYSSNVQKKAREYTTQTINQVSINLDSFVRDMDRLTSKPFYDERILHVLRNHNTPQKKKGYINTEETNIMDLFISSLLFDRNEIQGIALIANDDSVFSNLDKSVKTNWDFSSSQWIKDVNEQDGGLAIIPLHTANYYASGSLLPKKVVSFARLIREPYTNKPLGYIVIDLNPNSLGKVISSFQMSHNSKLYILDPNDRLLYSSDNTSIKDIRGQSTIPNSHYLKATSVSDATGIKIIGQISTQGIFKEARNMTRFIIIISILCLIVAYVLATLAANSLLKPINHLQQKMNQVKEGSFKERANVLTHDEIGQLTEVFNSMLDEIDRLVKEVYGIKLKEKEAELSALQSQINPHFLYNTLESMNMIALKNQDLELSDMITSLGSLFRYTVDNNEQMVFLEDEISFIQSYLEIQSFRMGNLLKISIDVDTAYEDILVPKLILQPFVENVIEHGFENRAINIRISLDVDGDNVNLMIEDDGKGLAEPKIVEIEKELSPIENQNKNKLDINKVSFKNRKKGFALKNVHQRIQLYYGNPYGVYIDHNVKRGSRFRIYLPLQLEG